MKALSIRQPWASLIAKGYKAIELRTWKRSYRGPLAIHASKKPDRFSMTVSPVGIVTKNHNQPLGAIIAVCTLEDIIQYGSRQNYDRDILKHRCPETWFQSGLYGWVLTDIKKLDTPIPIPKGQLGLWDVDLPGSLINGT